MNSVKHAPDFPHEETGAFAEVHPVEALAEEYLRRCRQGEQPSMAEYLERYPALAEQIRAVFPALIAVEQLKPSSTDASAAVPGPLGRRERIGAYRLMRVLGRGGMGVVYEAEHESLGRRVALKVLPAGAARDAKLLARFQRESRAAAQLHHSNIVPVFEVGQEGDIFFYAMQCIQGQPMDAVLQELQRLRAASGQASGISMTTTPDTCSLTPSSANPVVDTPPPLSGQSELSMVESNYRLYCRNVARLGLQVAEALAYAHARGIVHRDIKPSNLLLDTAGVVWVSDFGLVKTQDPALTETGDLVGTLRYMAPERFQGECDVRADVYALGLTLYELLVLRPAFDAQDRLHLVEQIGHREPARLRVLDPRIPRDLETIVMKTIEKDPRRRYPTADELAADLRRYLADEPIKARRIGPLERLGRWGRRNPLVATLSAAVVLVAALGFVGVVGQMDMAQANERQAQANERLAQANERQARELALKAEQKEQEAQKKHDEVKALNEKLQVTLKELQATQEQLRRTLYAAHMNLAQHALDTNNVGRVRQLLEQHRPKAEESDLRGFEWYYLCRLCQVEFLTLKGHTGLVVSVAYSPDGKRLVSSSSGLPKKPGEVKMWDAQTGQELLTLKGAAGCVAFSPDGNRLVSGGGEAVKVWDAQNGKELLSIQGGASSVVFSSDGKRLASASADKTVKVWDAQNGKELLTLKGHTDSVNSVAYSPDGKRLASASADKTVKVWNAETGQEVLTLKGHTVSLACVAFSPDGKRLASGGEGARPLADPGEGKVWDAQTGQELRTFAYRIRSLAFSPDGKLLASAGKVWDALTGEELHTLPGATVIANVAFSPDSKYLAGGSLGEVRVWKVQQNPEILPVNTVGSGSSSFSADFMRLASPGPNNTVKVWDVHTGKEALILKGHISSVSYLAFSPNGQRLASGSASELKVWDAQTGQELLSIQGGAGRVVFSSDGKRLASASADKTVKVWDAQTGKELLTIKSNDAVYSLAFSPDDKRIASGHAGFQQGSELRVWDAQTGQELITIKGPKGFPRRVVFSPDGKRLTSAGALDSTVVMVWDAQSGKELLSLQGHNGKGWSVAFSPDGKRIASASMDGTVKVWDAQTGQELLSLKNTDGRVDHNRLSVAFSPDGHRLLSAGAVDGTVRIWDATPLPEKR